MHILPIGVVKSKLSRMETKETRFRSRSSIVLDGVRVYRPSRSSFHVRHASKWRAWAVSFAG